MTTQPGRSAKVAVIQSRCESDPSANLEAAIAKIEAAADQGAQIICLQELFHTLYLCQEEDHDQFQFAESIPGPTTNVLSEIARKRSVVLIAGLFEKRAAGIFHNTAVVIEADGSLLGTYRKMHIPDDPHYYEKFFFTPGDSGFVTFDSRFGRIGVCICWDQWFPEAARLTALQGADIIVIPTAIGWLEHDKQTCGSSQRSAWETMIRSHAIANGVFVAVPNRVGLEQHIEFWGHSLIADPYGNILDQATTESDATIVVDCDWSLIETARTHWPFFRDRRIDAYSDLTRRLIDD